MSVVVLGMNHVSAPLEIREKFHFPKNDPKPYQSLLAQGTIQEGVILSTCNRVEVSAVTQNPQEACEDLTRFISEYHEAKSQELSPFLYYLTNDEAIRHTFRVASSLDSMVVGETQILGQVKQAFRLSNEAQALGPKLHRVYSHAFRVAKRVRTETRIGHQSLSIGNVCVQLCHRIFQHFSEKTVLLLGAGEMMELMADLLYQKGVRSFYLANRSFRDHFLSSDLRAPDVKFHYIRLQDLEKYLYLMDVILVATSSPGYVLSLAELEAAVLRRKQNPIFCVDISVPRQVDPMVHNLDNVYLYNIDDLQIIVKENYSHRVLEAKKAETIVEEEVAKFYQTFIQDKRQRLCQFD